MSRSRKTIEVKQLVAMANLLLEIPETEDNKQYINQQFKSGICSLLEEVLHETGNYAGFNFNKWIKRGGFNEWIIAKGDSNTYSTAPFIGETYDRFYY